MKRGFDFVVSLLGLIALLPVVLMVWVAVRLDSKGPGIFWSERFGQDGATFMMPKFRSMKIDAPQVPTHLLGDGRSHLTRIGGFLRKTSLDELPQLYSVLVGDMSLVGPRPALFNQHDLMEMRAQAGVDRLRPGITGWAQINGRDTLPLSEKVRYEAEYLVRRSFAFDLHILLRTAIRVVGRSGIAH